MRGISILIVSASLVAIAAQANAASFPAPGAQNAPASSVVLVQAKKDETIKQKVKRVWRNIAGTTYDVGCPSLAIAFTRTTCTETGKDAQAKCVAKHPLCEVSRRK